MLLLRIYKESVYVDCTGRKEALGLGKREIQEMNRLDKGGMAVIEEGKLCNQRTCF